MDELTVHAVSKGKNVSVLLRKTEPQRRRLRVPSILPLQSPWEVQNCSAITERSWTLVVLYNDKWVCLLQLRHFEGRASTLQELHRRV